ncbi:MAG: hypothetical protein GY777_17815, partial [Candidatus Brocadiaceae bacterium]|nr:hypothetical protein [Candidatus Brocadiaceae bacterium]
HPRTTTRPARAENSSSDIRDRVVGERDLAVIRPVFLNWWCSQWRGWIPHPCMAQDPLYDRCFLYNRQEPHLTTTVWAGEWKGREIGQSLFLIPVLYIPKITAASVCSVWNRETLMHSTHSGPYSVCRVALENSNNGLPQALIPAFSRES